MNGRQAPNLPVQKLTRFSQLVPAQWVSSLMAGERPPLYDNDRFVVVHAHYRNRDAYLSDHIPGPSIWIPWHWKRPKHGTAVHLKN
jgi:3-mercaptopyruvate sulfurtransferase SseA